MGEYLLYKREIGGRWEMFITKSPSFQLYDLKAGTLYEFFVRMGKEGKVREEREEECLTRTQTKGEKENLISNPSFEEEGKSLLNPFPYVRRRKEGEKLAGEDDSFSLKNWAPLLGTSTMRVLTKKAGREKDQRYVSMRKTAVIFQYVFLNQTEAKPLLFSIQFQASFKGKRGRASVSFDILYDKVSELEETELVLEWEGKGKDWEESCLLIEAPRKVYALLIYLISHDCEGEFNFDQLRLTEVEKEGPEEIGCKHAKFSSITPQVRGKVRTLKATKSFPKDSVTLATQLSLDRMPALEETVKRWNGPLSVSVLISEKYQMEEIEAQRRRNKEMKEKVDFHLFDTTVTIISSQLFYSLYVHIFGTELR